MTFHIDHADINRALEIITYLKRHVAALQHLPGHSMELEGCRKAIGDLLRDFPALLAIRAVLFRE